MKIGILTYHDIDNYGARLQAASLAKFLTDEGFWVEVVDFSPIRKSVRAAMRVVRPALKLNFRSALEAVAYNQAIRSEAAEAERIGPRKAYLSAQVPSLCAHYDVLICGSDEVWNFGNYLGYMPPYILDFKAPSTTRKISYAASIGDYSPTPEVQEKMRRSLTDYHAILVRDPHTLELVTRMGLRCNRVVDPVFLTDLEPMQPTLSKYAMITGHLTTVQLATAIETAKRMDLKPLSPGYTYPRYESIAVRATMREWIGYVRSADIHITSLFHGASYSIKYGVPFAAFQIEGKSRKLRSLVDLFMVQDYLVPSNANVDRVLSAVTATPSSAASDAKRRTVELSQNLLRSAVTL